MQDANSKVPGHAAFFTANQDGFNTPSTAGATVSSWITFDASYQYNWEERNMRFDFTINNLFDRDPPFSQQDYGYDAFTGNPLGRTIKFGVTKLFE